MRKTSKKGFTLIELLTVIAILAVILLVSAPTILGVLDKARKNTFKSQVLLYTEGLKHQIALNKMGEGYADVVLDLPDAGEAKTYDVSVLNGIMDSGKLTEGSFIVEADQQENLVYYVEGITDGHYKIEPKTNVTTLDVSNVIVVGSSSQNSSSQPSTPVSDTTAPTISVSVSGTSVALTMTDDTAIAGYCIQDTNTSDGCSWVETTSTEAVVTKTDGTYYAFAKDSSNNISIGAQINVLVVSGNNGDAVTLAGYNWHIIGQDSTKIYLLMDAGQMPSGYQTMNQCTNDTDSSTDCEYNGSNYVYSWYKSRIREYLNDTFYNDLPANVKSKMVTTNICKDSSGTSVSYGGYTDTEIASINGATCGNGTSSAYTADYVRLITPSEYDNLSPSEYCGSDFYPVVNAYGYGKIAGVSYVTKLSSSNWLYSSTIGSYWTMGVFSSSGNPFKYARLVLADGDLNHSYSENVRGVRPVIVLKK